MDDRGDYNSSPCTSYRRAKKECGSVVVNALVSGARSPLSVRNFLSFSCSISIMGRLFQTGMLTVGHP